MCPAASPRARRSSWSSRADTRTDSPSVSRRRRSRASGSRPRRCARSSRSPGPRPRWTRPGGRRTRCTCRDRRAADGVDLRRAAQEPLGEQIELVLRERGVRRGRLLHAVEEAVVLRLVAAAERAAEHEAEPVEGRPGRVDAEVAGVIVMRLVLEARDNRLCGSRRLQRSDPEARRPSGVADGAEVLDAGAGDAVAVALARAARVGRAHEAEGLLRELGIGQ